MRYEDWDILLFARNWEVPLKEFKVACHVVQDAEFSHTQGSFGLPTVCCFVPSLPAGTPFKISIHSWSQPLISQATKSYSIHPENARLEVRLLIDGALVASAAVDPNSDWPHIIAQSFDFSKNGELEPLKFPTFRSELLEQNYWSPADELGRIKLVISEGFPRDSSALPMERVKNLVAFSFQHAPLEVLETSSIAWPNPSMWRREPYTSSMPVPTYTSEDAKSHAHSPRRRYQLLPKAASSYKMPTATNATQNVFAGQGPFTGATSQCPDALENSGEYLQWLRNMDIPMTDAPQATSSRARRSGKSTDTSMPDYADRQMSTDESPFTMANLQFDEEGNVACFKVPSNTPTGGRGVIQSGGMPFPVMPTSGSIPSSLAHTLTSSLLNQAMLQPNVPTPSDKMPDVWSRKETQTRRSSVRSSTPGAILQKGRSISQRGLAPGGSISVFTDGTNGRAPTALATSDNQRAVSTKGETMARMTRQENLPEGTQGLSDKCTDILTPASGTVVDDKEKGDGWGSPGIQATPYKDSPTIPAV